MPSRRRVTHGNSRIAQSHRRRCLLCCIVTALAGIVALVEYNLTARLSDHQHFKAEKNSRASAVPNNYRVQQLATAEESQIEQYRHQAMGGDTRITAYNSSIDGGESSRGIGFQTVTRLRSGECRASDCRVLITGCGRSGTHFLSEQLASAGVPIAHETIGKAGSVSWLYAAPFRHDLRDLEEWFSNEESVKLRASDDFQLFPVFHLVRHPLAAVASLTECFCGCGRMSCGGWADPPSWKWAGKFVEFSDRYCSRMKNGEVCEAHTKPAGRIIRSMEYWLEWNHLAESQAHFRIQLETVKLSEVAQAATQMDPDGLLVIPETFVQNPFASKRGRGPTRQTVSWEMMQSVDATLEARVWELAQSYGYSRDPP